MLLDGALGDVDPTSNAGVGRSLGRQGQDLALTRRGASSGSRRRPAFTNSCTSDGSTTDAPATIETAGPMVRLPAAALRSSGLEIMGGGGGSIPPAAIFETFPRLWELAANGSLRIDTEPVPLADVEQAWARSIWAAPGWFSSRERRCRSHRHAPSPRT